MEELDTTPKKTMSKSARGIRDVAHAAEVSVATVSRVFNHPETVRSRTRDQVHLAATQLGYIPDSAARKLGSQVSRRIGLLIPTIDDSIFTQFLGELQSKISKKGYSLLFGAYGFDPQREDEELRSLIESGVDAVVLCGEQRADELYELLRLRDTPFINFNIYAPDSLHYSVGPNFRLAASRVVKYLFELGHKDIGYLDLFTNTNDRAAQRYLGVKDAFAENEMAFDPSRFIERSLGFEDGRIGFQTLRENFPEVTAVICGTDVFALGALFHARDNGISVPEDMSIVGFDNLELAAQVSPKLTTVNLPSSEMGKRVAESILRLIEGKPISRAIELDANLIVRESTGPVSLK